jgi:hypothetical protein
MERDLKSTWKLKPKLKAKRKGDVIMIGMIYETLEGRIGILTDISGYGDERLGTLKLKDGTFIYEDLGSLKLLPKD